MTRMLIFKKTIDRSSLREGFTIPSKYHNLLFQTASGPIAYGVAHEIKIIINGTVYDAILKNQLFDQNKYAGHKAVIQIRYSVKSPLAERLREIFWVTQLYVEKMKMLPENIKRKVTIRVPEIHSETFELHATDHPFVFELKCETHYDRLQKEQNREQKAQIETMKQSLEEMSLKYDRALRQVRDELEILKKEKNKITVTVIPSDPNNTEVKVEPIKESEPKKETEEKQPTTPPVTEPRYEFDKYIVVYDLREKVYAALDKYLKGKTGVNAMMVVVAARSIKAILKVSHGRFDARYKGIVSHKEFYKYIDNEKAFDAEELRKMKNNLCDAIGLPRPE